MKNLFNAHPVVLQFQSRERYECQNDIHENGCFIWLIAASIIAIMMFIVILVAF